MIFCGHCGQQLKSGIAFCSGCGAKAAPTPQVAAPAPAPAPHPAQMPPHAYAAQPARGSFNPKYIVLIGCALLLIWLALPFVVIENRQYDWWGWDQRAVEITRVTSSGYNAIFGSTYDLSTSWDTIFVRIPGMWSAAVFLLIPIVGLVAALFLFKKGAARA